MVNFFSDEYRFRLFVLQHSRVVITKRVFYLQSIKPSHSLKIRKSWIHSFKFSVCRVQDFSDVGEGGGGRLGRDANLILPKAADINYKSPKFTYYYTVVDPGGGRGPRASPRPPDLEAPVYNLRAKQ